MKLISMTDFVLQQSQIGMEVQSISNQNSDRAKRFRKIVKYAQFLKQPLELSMFVACDEDGNVLNEPEPIYLNSIYEDAEPSYDEKEVENYKKAKQKVIFNGFYMYANTPNGIAVKNDDFYIVFYENHLKQQYKIIEDLIQLNLEVKYEI